MYHHHHRRIIIFIIVGNQHNAKCLIEKMSYLSNHYFLIFYKLSYIVTKLHEAIINYYNLSRKSKEGNWQKLSE